MDVHFSHRAAHAGVLLVLAPAFLAGCLDGAGVTDDGTPDAFMFLGAQAIRGPMALPVVPVNVTDDGVVKGEPSLDLVLGGDEVRYDALPAFAACDEVIPAPDPARLGDGILRYHEAAVTVQGADPLWYDSLIGEPVRVQDFPVGQAAWVTWGEHQFNLSQEREAPHPSLLIVVRLNDTILDPFSGPGHPNLTHEGFAVFTAMAPYSIGCKHASWTNLTGPDLGFVEGDVLVADIGTGVWNPRVITIDVGIPGPFEAWKNTIGYTPN